MTDVLSQLVETEKIIRTEYEAYWAVIFWEDGLPRIKPTTEMQKLTDEAQIEQTDRDSLKSHYFETLKQILQLVEEKRLMEIFKSCFRLEGVFRALKFAINYKGDLSAVQIELEDYKNTVENMKKRMSEGSTPLWYGRGYVEGLELAIKIMKGENVEL